VLRTTGLEYVTYSADLPIGYMGLRLGLQEPRGPPTNCGMHRVNGRYMII